MRFMILVKASKESEAGVMPSEEMLKTMADYHEQLAKAGVLLDGNGLHPSSKSWRFTWSGGKKTFTDGPFTEGKELVAGYTMIQVKSREEAIEWTKRFPNPGIVDGGTPCLIASCSCAAHSNWLSQQRAVINIATSRTRPVNPASTRR